MRHFLTGVAVVVMALVSGVLAATNLPARVDNNTNAPAAVRKPMLLAQPVAGEIAVVTRMAPAGVVTGDGVVSALGGVVKAGSAAAVAGFGQAVAGTNGLVAVGLSPAGRVVADFVREIHSQQGVENDVAFLTDVDVWRSGPLGEIVTQAIRVRQVGDMATYSNLLSRYWREYNTAVQRRVALEKPSMTRKVK